MSHHPLVHAAYQGRTQHAREILARHDVSLTSAVRDEALRAAGEKGQQDIVALLLPLVGNEGRATALYWAALHANLDAVKAIAPTVDFSDLKGWEALRALDVAVRRNATEVVRHLLAFTDVRGNTNQDILLKGGARYPCADALALVLPLFSPYPDMWADAIQEATATGNSEVLDLLTAHAPAAGVEQAFTVLCDRRQWSEANTVAAAGKGKLSTETMEILLAEESALMPEVRQRLDALALERALEADLATPPTPTTRLRL